MTRWSPPNPPDPEDELKAADALLDKADALLRRHRGAEPSEHELVVFLDDDDLPLLNDVVDDGGSPPRVLSDAVSVAPEPTGPTGRSEAMNEVLEHLINLDTEIARVVEAWFAEELPQLLSRELDKLSERLREEALAHLRATLLPALSERISRSLSEPGDTKPKR